MCQTATIREKTERLIGTCRHCRKTHRVEIVIEYTDKGRRIKGHKYFTHFVPLKSFRHDPIYCGCCPASSFAPGGMSVTMDVIRGKVNPNHKCDPRCTGATGHDCECSCGGANHGADHQR